MRVQAAFGAGLNTDSRFYQTQLSNINTAKQTKKINNKKDILYTGTGIALGAASLAATGIYLVKRKQIKDVFTALSNNPITQSMPVFLKKELSKNHNYTASHQECKAMPARKCQANRGLRSSESAIYGKIQVYGRCDKGRNIPTSFSSGSSTTGNRPFPSRSSYMSAIPNFVRVLKNRPAAHPPVH